MADSSNTTNVQQFTPSKRKPDLNTSEIRANLSDTCDQNKKKPKVGLSNTSILDHFSKSQTKSTMPATAEERFEALMDRTEVMVAEWQSIKEKLTGIDFDISQIKDRQDRHDSRLKDLQSKVEQSAATIYSVRKNTLTQSSQQEQYSRNYNLRIYGLEEKKDESINELEGMVIKFFNEKLGVQVEKNDIDVIHRLGRPKQTSDTLGAPMKASTPKRHENGHPADPQSQEGTAEPQMETETTESSQPRTIIVRFVRRKIKNQIIANRRKLKKKAGETKAVVIKEDLTKFHHQLLAKAKDVGEKAWSSEGKIFMKLRGKVREVHEMSELL